MDRLQALEVFMLVAKLGSFTAASRAANLTASRVTHLIQNLEKELGVSLFSRTTRRVSLSSAGQALFEPKCRIKVTSDFYGVTFS